MDYHSWNNAIAKHFFNPDMADKEVFLYITKSEIINIGGELLKDKNKTEIWDDFIDAIRDGFNNKVDDTDIIKTLLWLFDYYERTKQSNSDLFIFPIYIAYLVLFILPLTDDSELSFDNTGYYSRINTFLTTNSLPPMQNQTNSHNWNKVWRNLKYWSKYEKNCEIGYFEIHEFGSVNWKFVSIPLSQCLIKLSSLKKLPKIFYQNNILPNQNIQINKVKTLIINNYRQLELTENVLKAVYENDEFGKLLVKIILLYYENWNGEEVSYARSEIVSGTVKPWTLTTLKLGLNINYNNEEVDFFFRLFSKNEFPEELIFNKNLKVIYEKDNWSKKIIIPGLKILNEKKDLIFEDQYNKWKTIFKYKNIIFFVSGTHYSFSGWIETSEFVVSDEAVILCDEIGFKKLVSEFPNDLSSIKRLKYEGLDNYYLFKVVNTLSNEFLFECNIVKVERTEILYNDMLKLNKFDYLSFGKPSVTIPNVNSDASVYLKYNGIENEIRLETTQGNSKVFKLPKQIFPDVTISLYLEKESKIKISEFRLLNGFNNSKYYSEIPFRNSWSEITDDTTDYSWRANKNLTQIVENSLYGQSKHYFLSEINNSNSNFIKLDLHNRPSYNSKKDIILTFISCSGKLSFEKYFSMFEQLLSSNNFSENTENHSLSKHLSLRYLEGMGHIDVDEINSKIIVNEPQIILIPNRIFRGRQAILIGARNPDFVNDLISKSRELKIKVEIEDSTEMRSELRHLMPQVIKISAQGEKNENFGETKFQILSNYLKILFEPSVYIQPWLLISSPKIDNYENRLTEDDGIDYEWARQIFNPNKLNFEISTDKFDKNLCLLKYHFTNYHYIYKLWIDGKCYKDNNIRNTGIDPEWGRFFVLFKLQKNILLFDDNNNSLAVPITVPLPRFLNKALILMSGNVPKHRIIKNRAYNIYSNLIPSLTHNIFLKLGQIIQKHNFNEE